MLVLLFAVFGAAELAGAFLYLTVPVYFDFVEPLIPSIAAVFLRGQPIYPAPSSSAIYGSMYGPLLFEICAGALKLFGATVLASKAPFVAAFFLTVLATYTAIRLQGPSWKIALFCVSTMLMIEAPFQYFPFWTRSEPVLTMLSAVGLLVFSATMLPATVKVVLVAGLAGAACDLKPHGVLFLIPPLTVLILSERSAARRIRQGALAALALSASALLPFLPHAVSPSQVLKNIHSYYVYLHLASTRGLSMPILANNLFVVLTLAGLLLVISRSTNCKDPQLRAMCWVCAGCSLLTAVAGSIPGGGSHHLLGYLPIFTLVLGKLFERWYQSPTHRSPSRLFTMAIASAFLISFGVFIGDWPDLTGYYFRRTAIAAGRADIQATIHDPRAGIVEVGLAEKSRLNGFLDTLRVLPIFANQPLILDEGALIDLEAAGFDPEISESAIENCRVNTWLIPGDVPFESAAAKFPPRFREDFHKKYVLIRNTSDIRVWRCKE